MVTCPYCKYELDTTLTACQHCGRLSNFPNVLMANDKDEVEALEGEVRNLIVDDKVAPILESFSKKVAKDSHAVIARPIAEMIGFFSGLNNVHQTFHQRLNAGAVLLDKGRYDQHRPIVDRRLFSSHYEQIAFAALSLTDFGVGGNYGRCHLTFDTKMISHRASVFRGNSFDLLVSGCNGLNVPVPKGLRATWKRRGQLAIAKLAGRFSALTTKCEFPELLNDGVNDFIEVHIFGSITYRSFRKVVLDMKNGLAEEDAFEAEVLKAKLGKWSKQVSDWNITFLEHP